MIDNHEIEVVPSFIGLLNGSGGAVVVGHEYWMSFVKEQSKPGTNVLALPEIHDEIIQHAAFWLPLFRRDVVVWPTCQASTSLFTRMFETKNKVRCFGFKSLWMHWCDGSWNKRGNLERLI